MTYTNPVSDAKRQPQWQHKWSIAIYSGDSPLKLSAVDPRGRPTLTSRDVTDVSANAVADPFLLRRNGLIYMFFEVMNGDSGRGEIAYATSQNGIDWQYEKVVLREPFHLSYPQVFDWQGAVYMIPETRQAEAIRLYRADAFPGGWRHVATLQQGSFADSTLHYDGRLWWMFAQRGLDELCLFIGDSPAGPWREHPSSPLWVGNRTRTRPGGRLLTYDGRLIRFAQDGWPSYGSFLRAFQIDRLDEFHYEEHELPESPILGATRSGWNAMAMHHVDAIQMDGGVWLAAVDGASFALF